MERGRREEAPKRNLKRKRRIELWSITQSFFCTFQKAARAAFQVYIHTSSHHRQPPDAFPEFMFQQFATIVPGIGPSFLMIHHQTAYQRSIGEEGQCIFLDIPYRLVMYLFEFMIQLTNAVRALFQLFKTEDSLSFINTGTFAVSQSNQTHNKAPGLGEYECPAEFDCSQAKRP